MKITWLGHSCFKVEKYKCSIVFDPYADGTVPGLKPLRVEADQVICSHEHGDHYGEECVTLLEDAPKSTLFQVKMIQTYHDEVQGAKRGMNRITILDDGKEKLVHLGDLGCELEPDQKELLKNADVILVPVGGYYTIDGKQAAALIKELNPRIVIPMHYRDDQAGFGFAEISTVDDFTEAMGKFVRPDNSELDTEDIFAEQVVVLKPKNAISK